MLSLLLLLGSAVFAGGSPTVTVRPLTLDFAGTPSKAELLLPGGPSKAPLVLLIQGTGLEDMNGSFASFSSSVVKGSMGKAGADPGRTGVRGHALRQARRGGQL